MSALASLALATGLVCALAPLAQAARIGTTGSAHDVSLIWLCLYTAGSAVWLIYGVAIGSLPLMISQSAALASASVVLVLAGRHRRDAARRTDREPRRNANGDTTVPAGENHSAVRRSAARASVGSRKLTGR